MWTRVVVDVVAGGDKINDDLFVCVDLDVFGIEEEEVVEMEK